MQRLFKPLAYFAVPAAAFLTFLVQPIVGKLLMPVYGGSAGTWMTISLFFQAALLAGYALAFWLNRQSARVIAPILGGLAVVAPLVTKLPPWDLFRWPEWQAVLSALTLSLLPAMLLTTSVGLVIQEWIRRKAGKVPYYLYGVSNLGSVLALVSYPFYIEPTLGLSAQIRIVKGLLGLLGLAVLVLAWHERAAAAPEFEPAIDEIEPPEDEIIPTASVLLWLVVAFCTCVMMLSAIRILSAEIGSNPLSWLVPLGIYLLSFTLTFSGWWRPGATRVAVLVLGVALYGYMTTKGWSDDVLSRWPRAWLAALLAGGTLAGHGLIYQLRPVRSFSTFYLVVALAGTAAGVYESVIAPRTLDRNSEFAGAAFVLLLLCGLALLSRREYTAKLALAALLVGPSAWIGFKQVKEEDVATSHMRNYYGSLVLRKFTTYTSSSNETTLHGLQLNDAARSMTPTTYYASGSGAGVVIRALQAKHPSITIGVVGLGTGTLATYARPTDTIVFWDINPLAIAVAKVWFSFLKDCPGKVDVRMIDGRLGLAGAAEKFDVLIVDAFSGDSIPIHLLTREAIETYRAKLGDGILLMHISNRYIDLFPVLVGDAYGLGLKTVNLTSTPSSNAANEDEASKSKYVLLYPPSREPEVEGWIHEAMQKQADYDYQVEYPQDNRPVVWTDDRNAIIDVLRSR